MSDKTDIEDLAQLIASQALLIEAMEAVLRGIVAVEVVDPWSACELMHDMALAALAALAPEREK